MKKVFKADIKCRSCGGTGLYVGMAERDDAAVQCHACKGSGREHYRMEYEPFAGRDNKPGVKLVYQVNPGICVGSSGEVSGGMPFADWQRGQQFERGMEMRSHTCPMWWYQCAGGTFRFDWDECNEGMGDLFSRCPSFKNKAACWARFDKEATP